MRLYDYAASANCLKVRLLLGLLGQGYERTPVDIFAGDTLSDEYARLNPMRETPVLELDDGTVLTESNAILWYLGEGSPFLPGVALDRGRVVQWLSFEQAYVMSGIGGARFRRITDRDAASIAPKLELGRIALERLDEHLSTREYLVGQGASIADVSCFAYTHVAADAGFDLDDFPAVGDWLGRIAALPGFANDLEPYPDNARPGASRSIYD